MENYTGIYWHWSRQIIQHVCVYDKYVWHNIQLYTHHTHIIHTSYTHHASTLLFSDVVPYLLHTLKHSEVSFSKILTIANKELDRFPPHTARNPLKGELDSRLILKWVQFIFHQLLWLTAEEKLGFFIYYGYIMDILWIYYGYIMDILWIYYGYFVLKFVQKIIIKLYDSWFIGIDGLRTVLLNQFCRI